MMAKVCFVEGCEKPYLAKGLCGMHYMRLRTTGTTEYAGRKAVPAQERFWRFVDKTGPVYADMGACWLWTGAKSVHGYGILSAGRNLSPLTASRVSYFIANGAVADDVCILHRCDNPACVNPKHLFSGTKKENTQDMISKGRHSRGSKHPNAKLKESDILQIRKSSKSIRQLAKEFGVSHSNIGLIKQGKKWRHVS